MYQVYKVVSGDTLESIASSYNCSCDDLIRLNGSSVLGDFIVVPNELYIKYVVKNGDTLFDISKRYGVDLDVLYAINGLESGDIIYPNQDLLIPNALMYLSKDSDSFSGIARDLGVDVNDLVRDNLDLLLIPGQVVIYKRD